MKIVRALVADDDEALCQLMARRVERLGFSVELAADGRQAAVLLRRHTFDVLVTDINMPGHSGLELLELARAQDPHIQVVIVTAAATLENAVEALNNGAFGYLMKPFDHLSVLENTVARAYDVRRLTLENLQMAAAQRRRGDLLEAEITERLVQFSRRERETRTLLDALPFALVVRQSKEHTWQPANARAAELFADLGSRVQDLLSSSMHSEVFTPGPRVLAGQGLEIEFLNSQREKGHPYAAAILRTHHDAANRGEVDRASLGRIARSIRSLLQQPLEFEARRQVLQLAEEVRHLSL